MPIPEQLNSWLKKWIVTTTFGKKFEISQLAGDGSTRLFFRLVTEKDSFIVLWDPSWTLSQDYPVHQKFLADHQIPVPAFEKVDKANGILVMEDLGDEFLQARLKSEPANHFEWLRKALEILSSLHGETFPVRPDLPVSQRSFDQKKYGEEFRYTLEHLHSGLLGLPPPTVEELQKIDDFCGSLQGIVPDVFCHRDFHCRNILVKKNQLYLIDFQDARLGPPHYDIASILFDAYVPITEEERNKLVEVYYSKVKNYPLFDAIDWDCFDRDLSLVAYQRTIKAAGSFASFYTRHKKMTHLPYLIPALELALGLQQRLSKETASLHEVFPLQKWIDAFRALKIQ